MIRLNYHTELLITLASGLLLVFLIGFDQYAPLRVLDWWSQASSLALGLLFVFLVPGYFIQAALFPHQDDLDGYERLALAFGLSIAWVVLIVLVLNDLPWGIAKYPMLIALLTSSLMLWWASWLRRRRIAGSEPFRIQVNFRSQQGLQRLDKTQRRLYTAFGFALICAAIALTAIILPTHPSDRFVEFYLLNSQQAAENYPRKVHIGQPVSLWLGIVNKEIKDQVFTVEVQQAGSNLAVFGPYDLASGEKFEELITFNPTQVGEEIPIDFILKRPGDPLGFRQLRLWLNTAP